MTAGHLGRGAHSSSGHAASRSVQALRPDCSANCPSTVPSLFGVGVGVKGLGTKAQCFGTTARDPTQSALWGLIQDVGGGPLMKPLANATTRLTETVSIQVSGNGLRLRAPAPFCRTRGSGQPSAPSNVTIGRHCRGTVGGAAAHPSMIGTSDCAQS